MTAFFIGVCFLYVITVIALAMSEYDEYQDIQHEKALEKRKEPK